MNNTTTIYNAIVGSRSYGLNIDDSDIDVALVCEQVKSSTKKIENLDYHYADYNDFFSRVLGNKRSTYYYQYLFPSEYIIKNELSEYIRQNNESIMSAQLNTVYNLLLRHSQIFASEKEIWWNRFPKRMMYSTFFCTVLYNHANGMCFADAFRPTGDLKEWLVAARQLELNFDEIINRNSIEMRNAISVEKFYQVPENTIILNDFKQQIERQILLVKEAI